MAKKITFEDNMKRLEQIADRIENGEMGIEETIKLFEEGKKLAQECQEYLNGAELKINKLIGETGDRTEEFQPE